MIPTQTTAASPLAPTGEDYLVSRDDTDMTRFTSEKGFAPVRPVSASARSGACARDDAAMNFLEGAENMFTYHQAELIRLTCRGLSSTGALDEAQYVLDRARALAQHRPASRHVNDTFNDYVMDFVEHEAAHLTYAEAEIVRRAARGCDADTVQEIQYLLDRARRSLSEVSAGTAVQAREA